MLLVKVKLINKLCCVFPASLESSDKELLEVGTNLRICCFLVRVCVYVFLCDDFV